MQTKHELAKEILAVIDAHQKTIESLDGDDLVITISSPSDPNVMTLGKPNPFGDDFTHMKWKIVKSLQAKLRSRIADMEQALKELY